MSWSEDMLDMLGTLWDGTVNWVRQEAAAFQSLVQAFIALGIAFGWWKWTSAQTGAVVGITAALLGMYVRSQVTPLIRPVGADNRPLIPDPAAGPGGRPGGQSQARQHTAAYQSSPLGPGGYPPPPPAGPAASAPPRPIRYPPPSPEPAEHRPPAGPAEYRSPAGPGGYRPAAGPDADSPPPEPEDSASGEYVRLLPPGPVVEDEDFSPEEPGDTADEVPSDTGISDTAAFPVAEDDPDKGEEWAASHDDDV